MNHAGKAGAVLSKVFISRSAMISLPAQGCSHYAMVGWEFTLSREQPTVDSHAGWCGES